MKKEFKVNGKVTYPQGAASRTTYTLIDDTGNMITLNADTNTDFEIRNRSNIVTINDEYKSLSFVEKQNGNQAVNKMNFIEIDSRIGVAAIAVSSPDVLIERRDQCWVRPENGDGNLVGQILHIKKRNRKEKLY
jgi:hypothetical protein